MMTFSFSKRRNQAMDKMPLLLTFLLFLFLFLPALFIFPATGHSGEGKSFQEHGVQFLAPKGRWAVRLEVRVNDYSTWYDSSGKKEGLNADFDGVALNSSVFPALAALGPSATLGTTNIDTEVDVRYTELTVGYGVTDNLTVGFILPYGKTRTRVNFSVDGGNIGFNPAFDPSQPAGQTNPPLLPVGLGAPQAAGTEGVRRILSDPAFGFAYKAIEKQEVAGIADPIVGMLWRFYQGNKDSFILGLAWQIGLAEEDDPDNLLDVPIADGSDDIRTRIEYYRDLGHQFDLRLLFEERFQLSDHRTLRVPKPGELLPPASSKERLSRNLGDFYEHDIEIGYSLGAFRTSATWHRYDRTKDRYTSSKGTDTRELEKDTDQFADQWRLSLSWSGIDAWQKKKIPLPLIVSIERQETFEGRNFPDVTDTYIRFTSFF